LRFTLPVIVVLAIGLARTAGADQVDALARTVETDGSEKARIAAVVALGQLRERRGVEPLTRALGDPSPVVRAVAASALGHLGDTRAIPALERACGDEADPVRASAREALARLRPARTEPKPPESVPTRARFVPRESPRRLHVVVKSMGNQAAGAHQLTARMHDRVVEELAAERDVSVDPDPDPEGFVVDGVITKLSQKLNGPWVEITCEVKITVSNGRGSLLSIVSGGATVQTARGAFRKAMEPSLQAQALDSAVHGAHQNLFGFLVRQK
jgi:hypothetical protein